jgi:heme/copper-type cytochrome/quinol oxidase subunit 2
MAALLAYTASGWTQVIVALSIFVPVVVALALTIVVLRGAKDDPDEQRWRRQAEERKRLEQEAKDRPE